MVMMSLKPVVGLVGAGVLASELIHQYRCRSALRSAQGRFLPAKPGERVVVLGAGIAGLTAARELSEAGMDVIVVERRHGVAMETSAANAGTLNFTARTMVASPENVKYALQKMWHSFLGEKPELQEEAVEHVATPPQHQHTQQGSRIDAAPGHAATTAATQTTEADANHQQQKHPHKQPQNQKQKQPQEQQQEQQHHHHRLHHHHHHHHGDEGIVTELIEDFRYFFFERRLLFTLSFWKWAANFVSLALTHTEQRKAFVDDLVAESLAALQDTRRTTRMPFEYRRAGSLYIHSDADLFHQRAREGLLAGRGEVAVTAAKAQTMEPSLSNLTFVGAMHRRNDAVGDCQLFCRHMSEWLTARGVAIRFGLTATDVMLDGDGRACAVQLYNTQHGSSEQLQCDHVVVCCACDSATPLATTGLSWLPIMPVRGYTLTGRANQDPRKCPTNYLLFEEPIEMAVTRLGDRIRFSSYAEITTALEPKEERLKDLRRIVDRLFPNAFDEDDPDAQEWVGRRPMTSDALPIVSQTHIPNVFLHTGHGADGWRWSHATARVLRAIMLDERSPLDPRFLALDRFWFL
ncbi:hypothetical protein PTSG_03126 [Salpingoeca rosetta]|uniref:FAD dependent oxidoreductase domain-containing protein n=1 Tax=Salpingoeca rosetta (strain ATCC 50818 / BSB-021) TaxID=946362 RepID=F2U4B1_SALR5|nr:uncharacterized protein PTSG_03126 [Salpingoeca rosetta]EGD82477.1 hypothetical protein PTSG_03126 [Salpingoeca rosetta]|eukprot:XP_004995713.1 hypothetical protein PTSG_03126 [Salpingoeca rosetta]